MAAAPEKMPHLYVCLGCHQVYAGEPAGEGSPPNVTWKAPEDCETCGQHDFVAVNEFPDYITS